ncbi:CUB and sushi domain-containing protein 1-like [Ruditapes philippinarum]|uniref:CUB and sushi domain-containing protein 1-like n=1 Tax=Ruditapes philippinarum TaxID=129788 RepID=UPI00295B2A44|nr:CUB and sushi domain-containing protein 1-like [Ruditapes philippinarum]
MKSVFFVIILVWIKPTDAQNDCTDPTPASGSNILSNGLAHGSVAHVSCDTGFQLNGDSIIICDNGTWSYNTSCDIRDCGDPTPTSGFSNHTSTTYQSTADITCDTGYDLQGSSFITCQSNGAWSETPFCQAHDCGSIILTDGSVSTPGGRTYGQTASLTCNTGYTLNGPSVVECLADGWNDTSTCDSVVCSNPAPPNGVSDAPSGFMYNELALISCDTGYTLSGDTLILCQANGTWTDSPTCEINDCGDPTPINGSISTGSTTYLTTLNVSCDTGFELVGSESITCQADSRWSEYPTCAAKDCGTRTISNGKFNASSGTTLGETATQSCNDGYILAGDEIVTCTASGWNGSIAACTIKSKLKIKELFILAQK